MNSRKHLFFLFLIVTMTNCVAQKKMLTVDVYETSAAGNSLTKINKFEASKNVVQININPLQKFQTITGFGEIGRASCRERV